MTSHLSRRRRTSRLSAAAIAAASALLAPAARGSMTLDLRLAGGGTTAFLGGDQTNADIPVQVWATVTGASAITPVPVAGDSTTNPAPTTGGVFDGLQYLYYNVLNSSSTGKYVAGGIDAAAGKGPALNAALRLADNGSQAGAVPNVVGAISVGSSTAITDVPKPRSASAVFDNKATYNQSTQLYHEYGNDGANILTSGKSASFLVETLNFKPTAFNAASKTTFTLSIPTATFVASSASHDAVANWFEDAADQSARTKANGANATVNGVPTIGTAVTFQDTLVGDTNLDGRVDFTDLSTLLQNYNTSTPSFALGNFNGDAKVDFTDLSALLQNFNAGLTPATPAMVAADAAVLADPRSTALLKSFNLYPAVTAGVPEPASAAVVVAAGGGILLGRRWRTAVGPRPAR